MALYVYRCEDGHTFEAFVPMAERNEPRACEQCGKPAERVLTAANVAGDGKYSYRHDK